MKPIDSATTATATVSRKLADEASAEVRVQSVRQEGATAPKRNDAVATNNTQVDEAQLRDAIARVNDKAKNSVPSLKFEPDADSGVVIIKVMNRETGEVIRQLPPEAVVDADANGLGQPPLVDDEA